MLSRENRLNQSFLATGRTATLDIDCRLLYVALFAIYLACITAEKGQFSVFNHWNRVWRVSIIMVSGLFVVYIYLKDILSINITLK